MRFVFGATEMGHTIQAGECSSATLPAVRIQFLLDQDISTVLEDDVHVSIDGLHSHPIEGQQSALVPRRRKTPLL